jgi:hypothetical protein
MKKPIITAVAVFAALTGLATAPALAKEKLTGEAKLAKILDGREAGKPVNCLPLGQAQSTQVIDKTAIVYKYGSTFYVNRPANPESLDDDDIMVTRQTSGQLCRLDSVQLRDRSSFFYSGFVALQDFVPYRKAKVASAR